KESSSDSNTVPMPQGMEMPKANMYQSPPPPVQATQYAAKPIKMTRDEAEKLVESGFLIEHHSPDYTVPPTVKDAEAVFASNKPKRGGLFRKRGAGNGDA